MSEDRATREGVWCGRCDGTGGEYVGIQYRVCASCDGYGTIPWDNYRGPLEAPQDAVGVPEQTRLDRIEQRLTDITAAMVAMTEALASYGDALRALAAAVEEEEQPLIDLSGVEYGRARDPLTSDPLTL